MYTRHFGLNSLPFPPLSDPHLIFPSNEIREAVCHFRFSRENHEAFFLLTGEAGAGKTTAIRAFVQELPPETPTVVFSDGGLGPKELLVELAFRLNVSRGKRISRRKLLRRLEATLRRHAREGHPAVLVLDEAHLLSDAVLEQLRLLSNLRDEGHPVLQICLVGQPETVERLRQPHLRSLRQRITSRYAMKPLTRPETREYLSERLRWAGSSKPAEVFHASAARSLHQISGGIPREINVLAGQAMMNAFVDHAFDVRRCHVRSVRKDFGFEGIRLPWLRSLKLKSPAVRRLGETQPNVPVRKTNPVPPASVAPIQNRRPMKAFSWFASLDRSFARSALLFAASLALFATGTVRMLKPGFARETAPPPAPAVYRAPVSSWATPIPLVSAFPELEPAAVEPVRKKTVPQPAPQAEPRRARSLADRYPSTLKVMSDTPAVVWLGNERLGRAPGTFTAIRPGRYLLKLEGGDGNILQKSVIVTPGSTTFVRAGSLDEVSRKPREKVVISEGTP